MERLNFQKQIDSTNQASTSMGQLLQDALVELEKLHNANDDMRNHLRVKE